MSRLKSYTQTERFYKFRRIATFAAVLFLFILVVALVRLNFKNLALQINNYSNSLILPPKCINLFMRILFGKKKLLGFKYANSF